jgi:hypothetical protein
MKVTIINPDSAVYVDGVSFSDLDLSACAIPENIHALQWYDTFGEIEFVTVFSNGAIEKPANQVITELPEWSVKAVEAWETAKQNQVEDIQP